MSAQSYLLLHLVAQTPTPFQLMSLCGHKNRNDVHFPCFILSILEQILGSVLVTQIAQFNTFYFYYSNIDIDTLNHALLPPSPLTFYSVFLL